MDLEWWKGRRGQGVWIEVHVEQRSRRQDVRWELCKTGEWMPSHMRNIQVGANVADDKLDQYSLEVRAQ